MDRSGSNTPRPGVDATDSHGNGTPVGLKSSPPLLRAGENNLLGKVGSDDASDVSRSDSEAETVVLPGIDGHSPSKVRKGREIKLEDKPSENGVDVAGNAHAKRKSPDDIDTPNERNEPSGPTLLGKRKRSKHAVSGLDDTYAGNSSGLSSIPTSPVAPGRSHLSNQIGVELQSSRSVSPRSKVSDEDTVTNSPEFLHGQDSRYKREHRRRSSRDSSGSDHYGRTKTKTRAEPRQRLALSHSPSRDTPLSTNRSASSGAIYDVSRRKRIAPRPLRATREHNSTDYQSDESSALESSHSRRRSKTNNQATTPTGDAAHKMARKRANKYGRTPLADAAEAGNYEKAKAMLAEFPDDLDFPDAAGNTPLQCASLNGHDDIVELLIRNKCNIHCKNQDGDSPLLDAVENGHLSIVKLLLEAGVDPRARNAVGDEPAQKINHADDNASAIRIALEEAKLKYTAGSRPVAAVQTPQHETGEIQGRRATGHGRANRTGQRHLYQHYNRTSLREAAAKGDLETVGNIIQVLASTDKGLDDAQATLNAARGGHHEVVEILLGLGNANPDPEPLANVEWGYATPMLAAIGGNNTEVVKLLLQQARDGRLNPTKKYFGQTYSEIARKRAGPCWQEEVRLLDEAYNEYKGPATSPSSLRNGKNQKGSNNRRGSTSRGESKSAGQDFSSPVRRGTARVRKELSEISGPDGPTNAAPKDKNSKSSVSDRANSPTESEPAKYRRRLLSGREMKAEKERSKSFPDSSRSPPIASKLDEDDKMVDIKGSEIMQRVDDTSITDASLDSKRASHRDGASSARGSSPSKRPRNSSMSQPDGQDPVNKRRRLEAGAREQPNTERGPAKPEDNSKPLSRLEAGASKEHSKAQDSKRTSAPYGANRSASVDRHSTPRLATKSEAEPSKPRSPEQHFNSLDDYVLNKSKKEAERKAAQEKKDKERKALQGKKEEQVISERMERERLEQAKLEQKVLLEKEREREAAAKSALERAKLAEEEDRARHATQKALDEEKRQQQAEADRLREEEVLKLAEEARLKEEDDNRKAEAARLKEEELQREAEAARQLGELERKRNEAIAERARQEEAKINARLEKLPPLIRFIETYPELRFPFFSESFSYLRGIRGDTIRPDLAGKPEAREQWVLNAHAALLLGDKDALDPRYLSAAGWEYILASNLAKEGLWRFEHHIYSMTHYPFNFYNPILKQYPREDGRITVPQAEVNEITKRAKQNFLDTDLYFIKVSDLMAVVPNLLHLTDVKLTVVYTEALPDESWLNRCQHPPAKWKTDQDSGSDAPRSKIYINGQLVEPSKSANSSPFPAANGLDRSSSSEVAADDSAATDSLKPKENRLEEVARVRIQNGVGTDRNANMGRVPLPTGPGTVHGPNGIDKGKRKDADADADVASVH